MSPHHGGWGGGDILFLVQILSVSLLALALALGHWRRRSLLSALYLLIEWTYFSQTYTNISLGGGKMLIRFW